MPRTAAELRSVPDDRYLSQMSLRIFRAGLKHELVDAKWPAFEEVWHGFDPARCAAVYDEELEAMLEDRRLIRHLGKLRAIRANAAAMLGVAASTARSARWLAGWPGTEIVGLWETLAKRFSQLGGNSAPMFLRMVGKDTFILTECGGPGAGALAALIERAVQRAGRPRPGALQAMGDRDRAALVPAQPDPGAEHRLRPVVAPTAPSKHSRGTAGLPA